MRGQSVSEHGLFLSDEKFISDEDHSRMQRAEVLPGDVLYTIAGSIGNACVVRGIEKANINQAIVKIRINAEVLPQYLADFLNSSCGRFQSDRLANGGVQLNINFSEAKSLLILLPSIDIQKTLTIHMDAARASRKAKIAEADALLDGLDGFLIEMLGLATPSKDERKVFAVRRTDMQQQGRLNSDYFHPERILAIRALESAADRLDCRRLSEVVSFIRDQIKTPGPNYFSLAHVQSHTGERVEADEEVAGACSLFKSGDVLFARLRPYLNKVYRAEADGCCSPEFHVLRSRDTAALRPDYLATILRSRLILAQTRHMMTGNTHPRLTNEDVVNLVIPVPKPAVQALIAAAATKPANSAPRRNRDGARPRRNSRRLCWANRRYKSSNKQAVPCVLNGTKPKTRRTSASMGLISAMPLMCFPILTR